MDNFLEFCRYFSDPTSTTKDEVMDMYLANGYSLKQFNQLCAIAELGILINLPADFSTDDMRSIKQIFIEKEFNAGVEELNYLYQRRIIKKDGKDYIYYYYFGNLGLGYAMMKADEIVDEEKFKICDVELYEITTPGEELLKYEEYLYMVYRLGKYNRTNFFKCNFVYRKFFAKINENFIHKCESTEIERIQTLIKAHIYEITGRRNFRFEENRCWKLLADIGDKKTLDYMQLYDLHQIFYYQRYNRKFSIPCWGPKEYDF